MGPTAAAAQAPSMATTTAAMCALLVGAGAALGARVLGVRDAPELNALHDIRQLPPTPPASPGHGLRTQPYLVYM